MNDKVNNVMNNSVEYNDSNKYSLSSDSNNIALGTEQSEQISKVRRLFIEFLENNIEELSSSFYKGPIFFSSIQLELLTVEQLRSQFKGKLIQFHMDYVSGVVGKHSVILDFQQSFSLIEMLTGEKIDELSASHMDVLSGLFSHLVSVLNSSFSSKFDNKVATSSCRTEVREDSFKLLVPDVEWLVAMTYVINDSRGVTTNTTHIFPLAIIKSLVSLINNSESFQKSSSTNSLKNIYGQSVRSIRPVKYQELSQLFSDTTIADYSINLLLDISMQLTVQLGQTKMQIKKILRLGEGSIIGLDKLAGEPVDLLVNNHLIAKGEVVVIDENFGVRITEITGPHERLENLISD